MSGRPHIGYEGKYFAAGLGIPKVVIESLDREGGCPVHDS
jgi:hypothetical protein